MKSESQLCAHYLCGPSQAASQFLNFICSRLTADIFKVWCKEQMRNRCKTI